MIDFLPAQPIKFVIHIPVAIILNFVFRDSIRHHFSVHQTTAAKSFSLHGFKPVLLLCLNAPSLTCHISAPVHGTRSLNCLVDVSIVSAFFPFSPLA